ncbi:hypothetical protein OAU50_07350, partial [Planctomycetota bacterium]|nr:hypothetical protein [Planctomycetota bacterium]
MPDSPIDQDSPNIAIPETGPYDWTVRALTKEVCERRPMHEFRIAGFFGPWGSGKTTLLQEVENRVN